MRCFWHLFFDIEKATGAPANVCCNPLHHSALLKQLPSSFWCARDSWRHRRGCFLKRCACITPDFFCIDDFNSWPTLCSKYKHFASVGTPRLLCLGGPNLIPTGPQTIRRVRSMSRAPRVAQLTNFGKWSGRQKLSVFQPVSCFP